MLLSRFEKTVFPKKNGGISLNFPKMAYDKFGEHYIFDLHEDKIVMYPVKDLGKHDNN